MLQRALEALNIQSIRPKLVSGKYASYSFSYQHPHQQERIGVVWTEDANMTSFFHIMVACQKIIQENLCQRLYLIRINGLGNPRLEGHKLYRKIFTGTNHIHIRPNLTSVHHLATYNSLVNSALAKELILLGETIHLPELQSLIRRLNILNQCSLLQDLDIIPRQPVKDEYSQKVKEFLLNIMTTQLFMGVPNLISYCQRQFPQASEAEIQRLIEELCQENKLRIRNSRARLQEQLIYFVPPNTSQ